MDERFQVSGVGLKPLAAGIDLLTLRTVSKFRCDSQTSEGGY